MRQIVTLAFVLALCALLSACGSSAPSTSTPSTTTTTSPPPSTAKGQLAAMRSAANGQHSVHFVSVSSAPGHTIRIVADVAGKEGILRITVTDHGQTGTGTSIVSGGIAFLRGDAFWMRVYFGFTRKQATKYAGRWISVPSSHPAYATASDEVTFPSFLARLFAPQTKLALVKAGKLVGVRGTVRGQAGVASSTIYAPAQGKALPVKQVAKSSGALGNGTVTMSNWNEAVHVSEPTAVSISTVVGG